MSDWNDDERHPTVRSVRSTMRSTSPDVSLAVVCKEIARDMDTHKHTMLWNEVEFVNYTYEFAPIIAQQDDYLSTNDSVEVSSLVDTADITHTTHMSATATTASELNSDCFDALVKNQTAYT